MDLIYRFLGQIAALNWFMWIVRFHFVPLGIFVVFALGVVAYVTSGSLSDAAKDGLYPVHVSAGALPYRPGAGQNYATVSGAICPGVVLTENEKDDDGRIHRIYYNLLYDPSSRHGILAKLPRDYSGHAGQAEFTGLLKPLNSDIELKVIRSHDEIDSISVDVDDQLSVGDSSGLVADFFATAGLWILILSFAFTAYSRYVVFRRTRLAFDLAQIEDMPRHVLLNADPLRIGEPWFYRVIEIPEGDYSIHWDLDCPIILDDGDSIDPWDQDPLVAVLWTKLAEGQAIRRMEPGYLYSGRSRKPAIRIGYWPRKRHRPESMIMTFTQAEYRDMALREMINRWRGYLKAPADQAASVSKSGPGE